MFAISGFEIVEEKTKPAISETSSALLDEHFVSRNCWSRKKGDDGGGLHTLHSETEFLSGEDVTERQRAVTDAKGLFLDTWSVR
jgi:hypothetical protein